MFDPRNRSTLPEKMDDPLAPEDQVNQALKELETINRFLGGHNVVLDALSKIVDKKRSWKILDIGSGGGDVLRRTSRWAKRTGVNLEGTGIDINPAMTSFASQVSKNHKVNFKTLSVWDDHVLSERYDIVMNNLFCHHFDDRQLVELVKRMYEIADKAVLINDLHRHWFAFHSIKFLTNIFSKTPLVKYDGPLSVARALTRDEWAYILKEADIREYSISWKWAFRWQIIIPKRK